MKTKLMMLILVPLMWNCKENPEAAKPKIEEAKQEIQTVTALPAIIKELAKFAEPTFSDSTNIDELMMFKELDANGTVTPIDMERAVDLYKAMTKPAQAAEMPIFEIQNTDNSILPIQGKGFGGVIWANVLVDRKTLEIKKVAFEHKAESDDYGAAMTQTSFENQFVGTKINLEQNTFSLQKAVEKAVDDGQIIDGISGATMTSKGAVEMMNEGLRTYRSYLEGE
ncbi:FMN-binding protein [Maribacter halichondriae]|uniref:FMN-binding protein n=1 Tax=Maribacter halichondriae TaxID=2980554 RepID=UPI002358120B|nr:FMN-binding protein [Maribacter sp. Hal144]